MSELFQPDPVLLAFIFVTQFVAFPVLGALALLRVLAGRGARTRGIAALVLCFALAMIWTSVAPALQMTDHALYAPLRRLQALGGGAAVVPATSLVFWCASGGAARWRILDVVHALALLGYLGLWAYVTWA